LKSKLIKGDALAFGLLDGGAGAGSEAQSADGTAEILLIEGASTVGANIVSDGANNDANVVLDLARLGMAPDFTRPSGAAGRAMDPLSMVPTALAYLSHGNVSVGSLYLTAS
jgi:hypothetical protein